MKKLNIKVNASKAAAAVMAAGMVFGSAMPAFAAPAAPEAGYTRESVALQDKTASNVANTATSEAAVKVLYDLRYVDASGAAVDVSALTPTQIKERLALEDTEADYIKVADLDFLVDDAGDPVDISGMTGVEIAEGLVNGTIKLGDGNKIVTEDEVYTHDSETGTSRQTLVLASQGSSFTVTVPKKLVINGERNGDNSVAYGVFVNGDITGDQTIHVEPKSQFAMYEAGGTKDAILATVTQGDTSWTMADDGYVDTDNNQLIKQPIVSDQAGLKAMVAGVNAGKDASAGHPGSIAVENLTAGSWAGVFDFNIAVTTSNASLQGTPATSEFNTLHDGVTNPVTP